MSEQSTADKIPNRQLTSVPSGIQLASCSDDFTAVIWDLKDGDKYKRGEAPTHFVLSGVHRKAISMIQWSPAQQEDGEFSLVGM